ncbi:MAG: (2Fe-2S)-binding protein [Acidobacteria bacterium]|nr:(2Fe-2S)-binding protein [Acidobacteriota bacterium]
MNPHRDEFIIRFSPPTHAPLWLQRGAVLSEHLTIDNSPLLFGCRTGICATCLIAVLAQENGELLPPADDEKELLEIVAPADAKARLACQIELCADLTIHYYGK